jgi:hypothetical protein
MLCRHYDANVLLAMVLSVLFRFVFRRWIWHESKTHNFIEDDRFMKQSLLDTGLLFNEDKSILTPVATVRMVIFGTRVTLQSLSI